MSGRSVERELERMADRLIRSSDGAPSWWWEGVSAFVAAVRWSEPLLVGLLTLHALFALTAFLTRRSTTAHLALLLLALGGVMSASWLNEVCGRRWREWATQNYFDANGFFVSMLFSAPLLANSFVIVVYNLYRTSQMLIVVKRKELAIKRAAQQQQQTAAASTVTTSTTTTRVQATTMLRDDLDGSPAAATTTPNSTLRGRGKTRDR